MIPISLVRLLVTVRYAGKSLTGHNHRGVNVQAVSVEVVYVDGFNFVASKSEREIVNTKSIHDLFDLLLILRATLTGPLKIKLLECLFNIHLHMLETSFKTSA